MIKLNIPAGYYAMGYYLENGYAVEPDKMASLAYFRKAADLGNPKGQYAIGKVLLAKRQNNQGFSEAADWLGLGAQEDKDPPLAIKYYQLSAKHGGKGADELSEAFKSPSFDGFYLDLLQGTERVNRYKLTADEIDRNPSARFSDIDKIVPLPPAPLPEWDDTFEYKKQQVQ